MSHPARRTLEALVLAAAFATAHTQSPLYYSNQNQYLLHGAALAERGHLASDWLAGTRDPTPLFSALVAGAFLTDPWLLQPAYFALLMGYFLAARWLVAAVPGFPDSRAARITFAALFTAAHAAILRWASVQLTGVDYPWYLQAGVAAQYLLGPGLQPSAFGVLLLVAVAAFANERPVLACAIAASACLFHSTYLLSAGLLVGGLVAAALNETGDQPVACRMLGASGLLMSLACASALAVMRSPGADAGEALRILAEVRIPHHCAPARWFDGIAGLQLAWAAAGWWCVRSHPLGLALFVAALGGAVLTTVQLATGSHVLALAFPWRLSVLLVPVATTLIIAKVLAWKPPGKWAERVAVAGLLALVAGGVAVTALGLGYRTADEHELYDHVRATAGPDDVYLLPVSFPAVGTGRGAVSNTFAPAPLAKPGTNQIPVDLQRFRLATGARVYVDFKSVPYAPAEVLEWHRRMTLASELTANGTWDAPGRRDELMREGVTHVVSPRTKPLSVGYLVETHRDAAYFVYRVK